MTSLLTSGSLLATEIDSIHSSDGSNGLISQGTHNNPEKLKKKYRELDLIIDQLGRFFAPITRQGDDRDRTIANGLLDYFTEKSNKTHFFAEPFEEYGEIDLPKTDQIMKDFILKTTHYSKILHNIEKLKNERREKQYQVDKLPEQKREWEKSLLEKKEQIARCEAELQNIEEKKGSFLRDLQQWQKEDHILEKLKFIMPQFQTLKAEAHKKREELHKIENTLLANQKTYLESLRTLREDEKSLTENIEHYETILKSLTQSITLLTTQIQELQDEADAYAVIKYVTYLNIYAALPTGDNNLHGYKNKLEILSPQQEQERLNHLQAISSRYIQKIVDRELGQLKKIVNQTELKDHSKFLGEMNLYTKHQNMFTHGAHYDKIDVREQYEIHTHYVDSFSDSLKSYIPNYELPDSITPDSLTNAGDRADRLIKQHISKWDAKLSDDCSLITRLGLGSALFNAYYDNESIKLSPLMISFKRLEEDFASNTLELLTHQKGNTLEWLTHQTRKYNWLSGKNQMANNYFFDLLNQDPHVLSRIRSIGHFIKEKIDQTKVKALEKKTFQRAFLKYLSYSSMTYALTYDYEGKKLPLLQSTDKTLPFSLEVVMAGKAYKWGKKTMQMGESFTVEQHGKEAVSNYKALKAWVFDSHLKEKDFKAWLFDSKKSSDVQ
jgi:predicted  nucleic acid-binding Zn-ribbon protein